MKIDVNDMNGVTVATLQGDVDLDSSPEARKVLLECVGRDRHLLVDMAAVGYIDSSGVASLVEALQGTRKKGKAFGLVAVSAEARRVLELGRLDRVFTLYPDLGAALARLG